MNWSSVCEGDEILAVIVFGSTGRGDSDSNSDLDVFALCPNDFSNSLDVIQHGLADKLSCDPFSIVVYTEAQFRKMLAHGSLFAWHLKLEGIVVSSKLDMGKVFAELQPYSFHCADIRLYAELLSDCRLSIDANGVNP